VSRYGKGGRKLLIYVLGKTFCRRLLSGLILLLALPLLHFYARQAINPYAGQHLKPRGEALKVYLHTEHPEPAGGPWEQLLDAIRNICQNDGF
jgi:hypothetical protein